MLNEARGKVRNEEKRTHRFQNQKRRVDEIGMGKERNVLEKKLTAKGKRKNDMRDPRRKIRTLIVHHHHRHRRRQLRVTTILLWQEKRKMHLIRGKPIS